METESGLSFLSRLCGRPKCEDCLGPGLPPLSQQVTRLECHGRHLDTVDVVMAVITDITVRLTQQLEAGVILVDCSNKVNIKTIARLLEDRVRTQAESEYRAMKEDGLSKQEREKGRMTAARQWEAVRKALARLFILHINKADCLETSILGLETILAENTNVSAVIILGLNAFYHQVHTEEGISYFYYMKRLRGQIAKATSDHKNSVKILSVELNVFGDKTHSNDRSAAKNPSSVILENSSNGLFVHFQGQSAAFSFNKNNQITWK